MEKQSVVYGVFSPIMIKTEYTTKPKRKIQKIVTELLFVLVRIEKKQEIKVNRDFVKTEKMI